MGPALSHLGRNKAGLCDLSFGYYLQILRLSKAGFCDLPLGSYLKILELSQAGLCDLPLRSDNIVDLLVELLLLLHIAGQVVEQEHTSI
jgi:hypothetical protein